MHDLIYDLAQLIAGEEYTILYPDGENIVGRTRHVAFHSSNSLPDIPALLLKANKMRTVLLRIPILPRLDDELNVNNDILESNKPVSDTLISSFKYLRQLRALNLSRSNIQKVPNFIGKLEHLRFLDLSRNEDIKLLPASITKLQNLQTLRLDYCRGLKELPGDTRNLISLRHLRLDGCKSLTHMPHGLGKLTALQTLSLYILGKKKSSLSKPMGGLGDLDGLNQLRGVLRIKGLKHSRSSPSEAKAANLERKQHLQWVILEWDLESGDESDKAIANDEQLNCPMMSLTTPTSSSPLSDLSKLKYLYLVELEELEYLPQEWLQNLTSLETLGIWNCRKMRISMSALFQHLTSLENRSILGCKELISNENEDGTHGLGPTRFGHLSIVDIPNLVSLPRELSDVTTLQGLQIMVCPSLVSLPEWIGNFTSLQELGVVNCPNLMSLPEGMHRLTSLRRLTIAECPCLEERCEQGMGEDWPKIAHAPNFRKGGDGNLKEWIASRARQYLEEAFKVSRMDASSDLADN
ncbi:putative disease resistance protein RGA1 [Corylus avellana]|uniref:putative disease resistance protein RGA1 n=1 Tax=Corylus avellana TaxID=13451 RepID=UPI002869EDDF|nr:putative disease resistance protein RGA1 [Corylus avellana]